MLVSMGLLKLVQSTVLLVEVAEKGGGGEEKEEGEEKKEAEEREREGERERVEDKKRAQLTYSLNVSCMKLRSRGKKCQTRMCVNNVLVE